MLHYQHLSLSAVVVSETESHVVQASLELLILLSLSLYLNAQFAYFVRAFRYRACEDSSVVEGC